MQTQKSISSDTVLKYLQIIAITIAILFLGKTLFIPMLFGLFIAIILYPLCRQLESIRVSRYLAITICLSIVVLLFFLLSYVLLWQLSLFQKDIPQILAKLYPELLKFQMWLKDRFTISMSMQSQWLQNVALRSGEMQKLIISSFYTLTNGLFGLFISIIYAALFLYHRRSFVRSLQSIAGSHLQAQLDVILENTIHSYFRYTRGLVLVYIIVGCLNSVGLYALGIKHALLFGMITAIMTIIPYVGIIVSSLLPISMAFITKDSLIYPLAVVGVFSFVQYLEANVIFPKVVGKQINVSTWATLVAIITGWILWGVAGMILFIPFVAVLKIVTDHIPGLRALNILLSRNNS